MQAKDKHSSLLRKSVNYGSYKLYRTGPWHYNKKMCLVAQTALSTKALYITLSMKCRYAEGTMTLSITAFSNKLINIKF
jgi:hypothetical protein